MNDPNILCQSYLFRQTISKADIFFFEKTSTHNSCLYLSLYIYIRRAFTYFHFQYLETKSNSFKRLVNSMSQTF
jgi:hypothetical protein